MDSASSSRRGGESKRVRPTSAGAGSSSICSLSPDVLCSIFALLDDYLQIARCSAVCKCWNNVIQNSTLLREIYRKKFLESHGAEGTLPSDASLRSYLGKLVVEEHVSALIDGSVEIHQWNADHSGVSQCRMKRGLLATGGDKVVRLWSSGNFQWLGDYSFPAIGPLIDFDFDESKIVGLVGSRLCLWRRNGKRTLFDPCGVTSSRTLCMRYIDPEAVVGCEDGRARFFDMYSGSCSRIIRIHEGPITCLTLDEKLIFSGSSFGRITLTDFSSGERVASLRSHFSPLGITTLYYGSRSHLMFAGSTAGYSHCWDMRTLKPLWETRTSSNVTYSIGHLSADTSTLAVGGIDGVLRILDQKTGEVLSRHVVSAGIATPSSNERLGVVSTRKAMLLPQGTRIDSLPKSIRPSITRLAVGLHKIVTTHNEKYVRVWNFHN